MVCQKSCTVDHILKGRCWQHRIGILWRHNLLSYHTDLKKFISIDLWVVCNNFYYWVLLYKRKTRLPNLSLILCFRCHLEHEFLVFAWLLLRSLLFLFSFILLLLCLFCTGLFHNIISIRNASWFNYGWCLRISKICKYSFGLSLGLKCWHSFCCVTMLP